MKFFKKMAIFFVSANGNYALIFPKYSFLTRFYRIFATVKQV